MASPAHHTDHAGMTSSRGMLPERTRAAVPTVALSMVLTGAATTMATASRTRSISVRNRNRESRVAATRGAIVFPAAVAAAAGRGSMGAFTRKAARATPGHILRPNTRNATTAMPAGGHSGVTFSLTRASRRLSRAAT